MKQWTCLFILYFPFSILLPPAAWACALFPFPSIHFNEWDFEAPFGPPGRPLASRGDGPFSQAGGLWDWEEEAEAQAERCAALLLAEARRRERLGRYADAARAYEKYRSWDSEHQADLRDRIEVLQQVIPRTDRQRLRLYLRARDFYDQDQRTEAQGLMQRIYADPEAGFLRAHALYALASLEYDWNHFRRAAALYRQLLREFPGTVKREAALIMAARCLLRSPPQTDRKWIDRPLPSLAAVQEGRLLLQQLLREYPTSRFRVNALGWLGRIEYVQGHYPEAMRCYLRQFAAATSEYEGQRAVRSLDFTLQRMNARDAKRFSASLLEEPRLAVPYLDYRLYHCDLREEDWDHLAQWAEALMQRHPQQRIPPAIAAALAEIHYHRGRQQACLQWAERALRAPKRAGAAERRDLAYYLRGAVRFQRKQERGAIADFETVVRRFPRSYLVRAARKNLALLYEARGDLGTALEHYWAIGYEADVAFLLDVRMTPAEIRRFIAAHPRHPQRDLLLYSLGLRYLRADDLDRAERILRQVPPQRLQALACPWGQEADPLDSYIPYYDRLYHPLDTIRDLRRLKAAVHRARTADGESGGPVCPCFLLLQKAPPLALQPGALEGESGLQFRVLELPARHPSGLGHGPGTPLSARVPEPGPGNLSDHLSPLSPIAGGPESPLSGRLLCPPAAGP